METEKFESMLEALEPYFESCLDDLPIQLKNKATSCIFPFPWDKLESNSRRSLAKQWDNKNDPAMEKENTYWWELECSIGKFEEEITVWELANHQGIPSEIKIRENKLSELNKKLNDLKSLRDCPPFSEPVMSVVQADAQSKGDDAANANPSPPLSQPNNSIADMPDVETKREKAFDSVLPYLKKIWSNGRFKTTSLYIRELAAKSGKTDSPFKESTITDDAFYLIDGGKSISHSIIEDRMKQIR